MRRIKFNQLVLVLLVVFLVTTPGWAALRDAYLGDVAIVSWLEGETVKVALANEASSRKSITIASRGWDQRWRPYFFERTVVVPAKTVVIESFSLSTTWRGEPLSVIATAWERQVVVEVQTSKIFQPQSYVVKAQEDVEIRVDLTFMLESSGPMSLIVDEYYREFSNRESGRIQVRSVEGGFKHFPNRNSVEFIRPHMVLSMRAPGSRDEITVFSFSLYQQQADDYWNYYKEEVEGPTILVYGRGLSYRDNSHLAQQPTPSWEWR